MVCTHFKDKLELMRNYRSSFIDGTTNVCTSTFKEHTGTEMHTRAMMLFKKQQSGGDICAYAPIARDLAQTSWMNE